MMRHKEELMLQILKFYFTKKFPYLRKLRNWLDLQNSLHSQFKLLQLRQVKLAEEVQILNNNLEKIKIKNDSKLKDFSSLDIQFINESHLKYIKQMNEKEIQDRIRSVSVENISTEENVACAYKILSSEGIVIIKDFLSHDLINRVKKEVDYLKEILKKTVPYHNFENEYLLVQSATHLITGYTALSNYPKAIANVRKGVDEGMIDVFNFDRLLPDINKKLREPFIGPLLERLLSKKSGKLKAANLNLYLNEGIKRTRGFHVDSYQSTLKGLCYITDVPNIDYGPYCYVRRSHVDTPWRMINREIGLKSSVDTESPIVDPSLILPCIAKKGTLILSDQSGIHRGYPQESGYERQVLVMRYL
jgi:hypothetical protein